MCCNQSSTRYNFFKRRLYISIGIEYTHRVLSCHIFKRRTGILKISYILLELLVEAGISPLDVIKITTRNGADAIGISNKVGTIERGKEADMIVLTENPVINISNTKKIE